MKNTIALLLLLFTITAHTQTLPEMHPEIGRLIDRNPAKEWTFQQKQEECDKIEEKYYDEEGRATLTKVELNLYENYAYMDNYWAVSHHACSWYCGGEVDSLYASSALENRGSITYLPDNLHDFSFKTTWIEGAEGYGFGESIIYRFKPENPRITKIIMVNGYVKSEQIWRENSRVKKLKMYVNEEPFAMLNLEDSRAEQTFTFEPVGTADREDWDAMEALPKWTIRFEIMEVYMGDKYDDTAISEIYFDGIDVH